MKIGLAILGDYYDADTAVDLAVRAESNNFHSVWIPEHFCSADAISILGYLSGATKRIKLATGIIGFQTRHPVLSAMTFASLDRLNGGRTIAGLGLSVVDWLDRLGIEHKKPLTIAKEALFIIKKLFDGDTLNFAGKYFTVKDMALLPKPKRRIPIFVAAVGRQMLSFAAEAGEGILLSAGSSTSYITSVSKVSSKKKPLIASLILSSVGERRNPLVMRSLMSMLSRPGRTELMLGQTYEKADILRFQKELQRRRFNEAMSYLSDDVLDSLIVQGSFSECEKSISRFVAAGLYIPILMPAPSTERSTLELISRIGDPSE
ncbi:MAG: LLM class flavin-dependent oxidoreductase [Conexivisphaerales archaeon]